MDELVLLTDRAVSQIDNIITAVYRIIFQIFKQSGYMRMLVDTIMGNEYLLISVSLLLLGFVIGILKRLISV